MRENVRADAWSGGVVSGIATVSSVDLCSYDLRRILLYTCSEVSEGAAVVM